MQNKCSGYIVSQTFVSAEGGYFFGKIKLYSTLFYRHNYTEQQFTLRQFYYCSRSQGKTISVTSLYNTYFKLQIEIHM